MEPKEYCEETWIRVTQWKAKLFDVAQVAQHFHSPGKKVVEPELTKLMRTVDDIGKKLHEYRSRCANAPEQEKQAFSESEVSVQEK